MFENMTKAYDVEALGGEFKKEGVEEGEKLAKIATKILAAWIRASAKLSTEGLVGKLDDLGIPLVDKGEKFLMEKLDGIDGKVDSVEEPSES